MRASSWGRQRGNAQVPGPLRFLSGIIYGVWSLITYIGFFEEPPQMLKGTGPGKYSYVDIQMVVDGISWPWAVQKETMCSIKMAGSRAIAVGSGYASGFCPEPCHAAAILWPLRILWPHAEVMLGIEQMTKVIGTHKCKYSCLSSEKMCRRDRRELYLQNLLRSCFLRAETWAVSVYSGLLSETKDILCISCDAFALSIFHSVNQTLEGNKAEGSQLPHMTGK